MTCENTVGREASGVEAERPPHLLTVIHTEEEFDWAGPFDPLARSVGHVPHLCRVQELFRKHEACPVYVLSHSVVEDDAAVEVLADFARSEGGERPAARIGTHLHPWVCPPFADEEGRTHSYPGNLPADLERAKIEHLTAAIERRLGERPEIYLAGRYGAGPNTVGILRDLGYRLDLSLSASHDFRADGGPDYRSVLCRPYWGGAGEELLRIPHTAAFVGWAARNERPLHPILEHALTRRLGVRSMLARLGGLKHIRLSPEGFGLADMIALTRGLSAAGTRLFVLSFHSPSVVPGYTPYVRSEAECDEFHERIDRYMTFFREEMDGSFADAADLMPPRASASRV